MGWTREGLIELIHAAGGDVTARPTIEAALATGDGTVRPRVDTDRALTLLADLAHRSDQLGVAAALAHQRLALCHARQAGRAARTPEGSSDAGRQRA
jgi:hypothetical protein